MVIFVALHNYERNALIYGDYIVVPLGNNSLAFIELCIQSLCSVDDLPL